jgi:hypothetical protein
MINTPLQTFQISSRCLSISVRPNGCLRGHVDNSPTGVLCQTHRQRRSAQYVTARMCICRRSLRRLIYRSGRPGSIMRSCPHHASAGDLSSAPLPRASTLPLPQSLLIYSMASPSTCLLNHLVGDIGTLRACATASSTMRVAAQRQLFGRCIVADSAACWAPTSVNCTPRSRWRTGSWASTPARRHTSSSHDVRTAGIPDPHAPRENARPAPALSRGD